jgi:glucose/mannose transport system substrate-binding protein
MVFPKTNKADQVKAQQLLASVITQPATQVAFSIKKGSIPIRTDVDVSKMDLCGQMGVAAMKDKSRHLANGEIYITPDQNGALQDVLTSYWNRNIPVEKVQKDIVSALRN